MKRWLMTTCVVVVAMSAVLAQQKKTAPAASPKPNDAGPSLAVTMKFIQDKLNDVGKIVFTAYYGPDPADNISTEGTAHIIYEVSNVVADPARCRISYRWKITWEGRAANGGKVVELSFSLGAVRDLVVSSGEEFQKTMDKSNGHPFYNLTRIDPPFFCLDPRISNKEWHALLFADEETANRVAKAMAHAVELCGGGNKDPF